MKFAEISNSIYNFLVKTLLGGILKNAFLVYLAKKLVDFLAKPIYDWATRKGYMTIKVIKAKEAQSKLDSATTKKERDEAIDEMP